MKEREQTLEDWVHLWIGEILPNVIKNRTRQMYTETMGRHILPYIGDVKLTELTSGKIEQWIETLKMQEVPFTMDGKMKEGTIRNTLSVLSGCLRDAQKRGLIRENPCTEVAEVIMGRNVYEEEEWLTKEQIQTLQTEFCEYHAENGYPIGAAYELILYTGITLSEVLALKWKDLSESDCRIQIHSIVLLQEEGTEVEELKGRKKREIPVAADLMERLQKIRMQYFRTDEDYVISETGDDPLRQDRFRAYLSRCSKRTLHRTVTPRMLRDTYAIYALKAGMDSDTVAELLGCSSSRQVINRYMPRKSCDRQQIVEQLYDGMSKGVQA